MSSDGGLSMQEAISAGRAKYVARHYKLALGSFTDAIKLCPCEVEKRKRKRRDSVGQEFDQNAQANQVATEFPALECGNPFISKLSTIELEHLKRFQIFVVR
ncbi:hypothetical protein TrVFT333_000732 [Trichoderma virens FT-333]|nr:hypothetical protein TrVFT333_000732 [Trichoderma virens FT-333]